ncbi:hypothetical protein AXF42_Ash015449 [Apostasia shenzhenica]|uniref:Uncharacterized protein n=1 Tax=Apostasia shenzhenica TaxID=1088818 RepID=A0A2H9ZS90_9ASPA|nr:hypothetical protein AXF42_Ash015449 [Apostasia shenzhenica]
MESSQHSVLQEEFAVYKSAMSALKADNKALQEKLCKADGDKEAAVASGSVAAVKAYKTSLPCRKERPSDLPLARWAYRRVPDVCRKPRLPGTARLDDHRISEG